MQYNCVQSLNKKLQETLLLTEFQLDTVLNEVCTLFLRKENKNENIFIFQQLLHSFCFYLDDS